MTDKSKYPLNALWAFEAAARHQSFIKASHELFVTPSAVSHQVKKLEHYFGCQLFTRNPKSLKITEDGKDLLLSIQIHMKNLNNAVSAFKTHRGHNTLTISVAPAFASKWLVPRLTKFYKENPDLDLRVSSKLEMIDFINDGFDAAIRFTEKTDSSLVYVKLFDEVATPLYSPLLQNKKLKSVEEVLNYTLLHDDSILYQDNATSWSAWFKENNLKLIDKPRGPHFSHPDHAIQACLDGAGILIGWKNLLSHEISCGRLIQPFEKSLSMNGAFYLVYPYDNSYKPKIKALETWLLKTQSQASKANH